MPPGEPRSAISLGVVCPMADEEETAARFVRDVLAHCPGFKEVRFYAVLDRACRDGTREIVAALAREDGRVVGIWAPENRFISDAYLRGYREALAGGADWILEIDAGYSHQPEDIPRFFEEMAKGRDAVFGSRFMPGGAMSEAPFFRKFLSRGGSAAANLLLGTRLTDMTSGFELFRRETLDRALRLGVRSRAHFFQTELKTFCRNLDIAEVPIRYRRPSPNVGPAVLADALGNLLRLAARRWRGAV